MDRCKHGVNPSWCAYCNPRKENPAKLKKPEHRTVTTVHGSGAELSEKSYLAGYAVICTSGRQKVTHGTISRHIAFVHIDGFPFLWAIKLLLDCLPNLHTIQIAPKMIRKLGDHHRRLCAERNVRIISGYHQPNSAWPEGANHSRYYRQQQDFLLRLSGEQKALFDELLRLDFHVAHLVARYFCLRGEEFKPQHDVALEVDFPTLWDSVISARIHSVFYYLDPTFRASKRPRRMAETMRARVVSLREILAQAANREEIAKQLGLQALPSNLPLSRLYVFEAVVQTSQRQAFQRLLKEYPRWYRVLTLRYGLEDGVYRTLEEIGEMMDVTRERIRQVEEEAFDWLGIQED